MSWKLCTVGSRSISIMVIHPDTVFAVLKQQVMPKQRHGTGRIVKVDNSFYLQTTAERIPMELQQKGAMGDGEAVRYTINNGIISLTPLSTDSQGQWSLTDVFTLSGSTATPAVQTSSTSAVTVAGIPAGLYLFSSAEEALAFVGQEKNGELLRRFEKLLSSEGVITIKIDCAGGEPSRATVCAAPDIMQAIQTLSASFTSMQLSSLSVDVWQQILFDRGNLPFDLLHELDVLLQGSGMPFPQARAGSAEAQNSALVHWLHSAITFDPPRADLAALAPASSASTMLIDLEKALPLLPHDAGIPLTSPGTFTLNDSTIAAARTDPELLPALIDRCGFTLEHALASPDAARLRYTPEQTLKSMLLHLYSLVGSTEAKAAQLTKTAASPGQPTGSSSSPNPEQVPNTIRCATADMSADVFLQTRLISLRHEMMVTMRREFPQLFEYLFNHPDHSGSGMQNSVASVPLSAMLSEAPPAADQRPAATLSSALQSIIGHIRSVVGPLSEQASVTVERNADEGRGSRSSPSRPAAAINTLSAIAEKLTSLINEVSAPAVEKTPVQPGPLRATAATASLLVPLRSAFETIDALIRGFEPAIAWRRAVDHTIAGATAEEHARLIISQSLQEPGATRAAMPLLQDSLSQTLSTALDRLESLQLLARQVSTSQGTQQIIALPIKFGDTWTEINVRFLHHKQRKTKKGAAHFSVYLDVAPPALGALHAHLDYRRSGNLHLSIEFKRKNAREWFVRHHDAIREALRATGTAAVRLDFKQVRKTGAPSDRAGTRAGSGIIDLTA
ncbi:MAG: hypothetical protein JW913_15375 [Chitinispirillaceae bacterium]|nr:hypothetical protein [Chitinispirillaceae bacterium]